MLPSKDREHFCDQGWTRVDGAVPASLCAQLVEVLEHELQVPVHDPSRWPDYGGEMRDLIPIWGHQAQWDIRQHPGLHHAWASLWGTPALEVSLDSCRFTPPWRPGYAEEYGIHWDHDPWDSDVRMLQGVLALTDTVIGQGGFRCVPSLYRRMDQWPKAPHVDQNGDENWQPDISGHDVKYVPARTGDLIVWDYRLPHGNSKNVSDAPRLAFYISMHPTGDEALRKANVDSWRTGRCVPWWRNRPGYDRVEPWPPAKLTGLGRRLLGLEAWQ